MATKPLESMLGGDQIAQYLHSLRASLGKALPDDWPEIERIIYETVREFEQLPPVHAAIGHDIPGSERLTADEKRTLGETLSRYLREYGSRCRRDIVLPLVAARVQIQMVGKCSAE